MTPGVEPHLVTARDDLADEVGMVTGDLADHEHRAPHVTVARPVQDAAGGLVQARWNVGRGSVILDVEGEREAPRHQNGEAIGGRPFR